MIELFVCDNEDAECHEDRFSPVADSTIPKLTTSVCQQKVWTNGHFDFRKAFRNRHSDHYVRAEMPKHMYSESDRNENGIKFNRRLYGLKEAAKYGTNYCLERSGKLGSKK